MTKFVLISYKSYRKLIYSCKHEWTMYSCGLVVQYTNWYWKTFSMKIQVVNIFGFVCHTVSVPSTQLWCCSHPQYVNERVWLCSRRTCFKETGGGLNLVCRPHCLQALDVELSKKSKVEKRRHDGIICYHLTKNVK